MNIPIPAKIGKYAVVRLIGRGGMGIVYEGTDPHLGRRVAIKMITGVFAENPDMLKRFTREAQSVASLQHANIVTLYELGTHEGNPYLVMEYLDGESLEAALVTGRRLSMLDKLSIIIQVCHGLAYVHRRGVIHRDIKPANIMLCKGGNVKIFDFGIARIGDQNLTRTGEVIGTLKYMAPEQVNSRSSDFRADIFSTGVVLYQLITSHLPFDADNTASTILKIVHDPPPPLSAYLTSYPAGLEEILCHAMAKHPEDRYGTADDFAFDLEDLLSQIKEELVGDEMKAAEALLDRGEVFEAQSTLARVLKVDPQYSGAVRLMREVQSRIHHLETIKQVQHLQELAEAALGDERFEEAQEHADRALVLDRENADIKQLRETIVGEAARAQKLREALDAAHAAQSEGNLEQAKRAVEEALALAPNDTQAKMLSRLISREIEEDSRHRRMNAFLNEARRRMASRRFTAAVEVLKEAEAFDAEAPEVRSLMESAVAGQQSEMRKRELDLLVREIEQALDHDDFRLASQKADEAAERFQEERRLEQLKALAHRQLDIAERKQFVDAQMSVARQLLESGRYEEVKEQLEVTLSQIGPEPRLQSLLATIAENLHRQRAEQTSSTSAQAPEPSRKGQLSGALPAWGSLNEGNGAQPIPVRAREEQAESLEKHAAQMGTTTGANASLVKPAYSATNEDVSKGAASAGAADAATSGNDVHNRNGWDQNYATAFPNGSAGIHAPDSGTANIEAATLSETASAALLQAIERQLAAFVGPLARVLVKRAAAKTSNIRELYVVLAGDIEREEDRRAFLAKSPQTGPASASAAATQHLATRTGRHFDSTLAGPGREEITPAAIEKAAQCLAPHLGPIATVLARKEAKSAVDLRDLYAHLAEHVTDLAEREQFLKVARQALPR